MTELQIADLEGMKLTELYKLAKQHQIPYYGANEEERIDFCYFAGASGAKRPYVHGRRIRDFAGRLWIS